MVWFLLFNGISTLCRLFNTKAILLEELEWYYLTHTWEDKGVHTFPKGICPKVNVIARLEFELAYYDSAVHRFNHYTMRTPLEILEKLGLSILQERRMRDDLIETFKIMEFPIVIDIFFYIPPQTGNLLLRQISKIVF